MFSFYELLIEQRININVNNAELNKPMTARQITQFSKRQGFITEINTDRGFIDLFDNNFRQVARARRIYI